MRVIRLAIITLAVVLPVSAPAVAQYRPGTPPVLAPPPRPANPAARDAMISASRYAAAGSPRIVVFWNRELTDRVVSQNDTVVLSRGNASGERTSSLSPNGRYARQTTDSSFDSETRIGQREVADDQPRAYLDEDSEWLFLNAFQMRLQEAGLKLVDRQFAIRALAASSGSTDQQTAEMQGIARFSDLLMAVVQTPSPETPLGVRFKITVSDLRNGSILATVVGDGSAPVTGPGRFVAGANGFERERAPEVGAESAGNNLAGLLLARLAAHWR